MTREEIYTEQLKALGIYEPAFDPAIKTLADLERDLSRAKKAWSKTQGDDGKPSLLDPHYGLITSLRRSILLQRDALGLTPKALKRLRGSTLNGPTQEELISSKLDAIAQRVGVYDGHG